MASNQIDPNFFLPPGVVDLGYDSNDLVDDPTNDDATPDDPFADSPVVDTNPDPTNEPPPVIDPGAVTGLPVPENIRIVSQRIRNSSLGAGQVVDVVIEVDDNPKITEIGVRLTPL